VATRIPLSWLRDYVDIKVSPAELAERLFQAGLEVEEIHRIPAELDWAKVYVGQAVLVALHPDADRLRLVTVEYGAAEPITVVTGAPNIVQGAKVILALAGSRLYNGHSDKHEITTLKPTKMRGIESAGMVCSGLELGLSDEHEGIVILPDDAPVGKPLLEYLGDHVLELELTPNLGRALSVIGTAREVAALTWAEGARVCYPADNMTATGAPLTELTVTVEDAELCPRYSGLLVRGVKLGPSPSWMQQRLSLAGMRPVNNIVDITNYVMLEWGQPLHAFDVHKVAGGKIVVRCAKPGETLRGINHNQYQLDEKMLLICDAEQPIAVAGVMGGLNTEVGDEGTADIFIESAHFAPLSVRRTARLLGLHTDASHRFERTVDPAGTLRAARRAAALMHELAGGEIAEGAVDVYSQPLPLKQLRLTVRQTERILGLRLEMAVMSELLQRLEFEVAAAEDGASLLVTVPSYRNDVKIEEDLIEEVARMYGYDNLPMTLLAEPLPKERRNTAWEFDLRLREIMVGLGLSEVVNYSLISGKLHEQLWLAPATARATGWQPYERSREPLKVINPLSSEREYLRMSLLPGLLETLRKNLSNREAVAIFELAHVFYSNGTDQLPDEPLRLSGLISGPRQPRSYYHPNGATAMDFFDAKGVVEGLLHHLHLPDLSYAPLADASGLLHPGRSAAVSVGGQQVGVVAELHPDAAEVWGLPTPPARVVLFDLDATALFAAVGSDVARYQPVSRYPTVQQDLALVVDESVAAGRVQQLIAQTGGNLVKAVTLFDIYSGPQVPAGKKSLAYSLSFQALDRQLTDDEVIKVRQRIVARLGKEVGATLRG